jgi:hypothetical protein
VLSFALALALAAPLSPGDLDAAATAFAAAHPSAHVVRAPRGGLEHASGFAIARLAAGDEENARAFLAGEGRAFGVADASDLRTLRIFGAPGAGGSAVFQRTFQGLPIFGGEVVVGWRSDGAITLVNGARTAAAAPAGSAAFRADAASAQATAIAAAPGVPGASEVAQGWLQFDGALYPAFRVEHDSLDPIDSFVSYVDGATGQLLYRISRNRSAIHACPTSTTCLDAQGMQTSPCLCAYRDSPLAPPTTDLAGNQPEAFPALGLLAPTVTQRLDGERTEIFDCQGTAATTASCTAQLATSDGNGNFFADPDPTLRQTNDPFAEQSAYFHIDSHSRFLDSLDDCAGLPPRTLGAPPRCFAERTDAGGIGRIFGYVNVLSGDQPFNNAFFSPAAPAGSSGVMVYGQGSSIDLAYDAEIVYHELTHAAVNATADFEEVVDAFGPNSDPGAMNEGTADTFAFAHIADALASAPTPPADGIASASCLSRFFGAELGEACLRQADNSMTCRGNGPNDGRNPGRDGEVHDDGGIWTGFTWSLLKGAYDADVANSQRMPPVTTHYRTAMARALFRALEATGPHPSFIGYAQTVRQRIADFHALPANDPDVPNYLPQEAVDFADCTIVQRDMAACGDNQQTGRSVALFSGERVQAVFLGAVSTATGLTAASQQYFIDVPCGATALHLQTGDATGAGMLYVRYGRPITFAQPALGAPQYDWIVTSNTPDAALTPDGCPACDACSGTQTPFGAGRWYFLPAGSIGDAGGNANVFQLGVSLEMPGGAPPPQRVNYTMGAPGSAEPNVCTWGVTGASPANPVPPVPNDPPALSGCSAPVGPTPLTFPATCPIPAAQGSRCGCGTGVPDGFLLAFLALLVQGWRAVSAPHRRRTPG